MKKRNLALELTLRKYTTNSCRTSESSQKQRSTPNLLIILRFLIFKVNDSLKLKNVIFSYVREYSI